jgi:hypothetical protein
MRGRRRGRDDGGSSGHEQLEAKTGLDAELSASIYMRQPEQDELHQYRAEAVAARTSVARRMVELVS